MLTGQKVWRNAIRNLWNSARYVGDRRRLRARRKSDAYCPSSLAAEVQVLEARQMLSAGAIDTTFGNGGTTAPVTGQTAGLTAIQSDGKTLVIEGSANGPTLTVYRYTANGALDATWGTNGEVQVTFGSSGAHGGLYANSVAVQGDGKILVAGGVYDYWNGRVGNQQIVNYPVFVARFNTNGTLDATFGNPTKTYGAKGEFLEAYSAAYSSAQSMAVDSQGRIVLSANISTAPTGVNLMRLNSNGTLDTTFGSGGLDETGDGMGARAMVLQAASSDPNGYEILTGGIGPVGPAGVFPRYSAELARFHSNGTVDTSFGSGGAVLLNPPIDPAQSASGYIERDATTSSIALEADGSILAAGNTDFGTTSSKIGGDPFVTHLSADGVLDTSFGNNSGFAVSVFSPEGYQVGGIGQVKVDAAGNIVAVATATSSTGDTYSTLIRYTSAGQLDTTFGADATGFVFAGPGYSADTVEIDPTTGKLITTINASSGFRLVRYLGS
jgi:uncharacterized delta-60 repeat protein